MPRHIANIALKLVRERNIDLLMWGDGLFDDIAEAAGITGRPVVRMQRVVNALARAPEHFTCSRRPGYDSRGYARMVRAFRPKTSATAS